MWKYFLVNNANSYRNVTRKNSTSQKLNFAKTDSHQRNENPNKNNSDSETDYENYPENGRKERKPFELKNQIDLLEEIET